MRRQATDLEKYLKKTYLIKDNYLKYTKKAQNSKQENKQHY